MLYHITITTPVTSSTRESRLPFHLEPDQGDLGSDNVEASAGLVLYAVRW
jgi:hypothetical protein